MGQAFDATVARNGDRLGLISPKQKVRYTYSEFGEQVDRLAAALLKLGLQKGDRVAVWSPNCAEWAVSHWACSKAGLVLDRKSVV